MGRGCGGPELGLPWQQSAEEDEGDEGFHGVEPLLDAGAAGALCRLSQEGC